MAGLEEGRIIGSSYRVVRCIGQGGMGTVYEDGESYTAEDVDPNDIDEEVVYGWFKELASALDYIHEQGIVHRDIKPGNLLMDKDAHVILTDFGISRIFGAKLKTDVDATRTMVSKTGRGKLVLGTGKYIAPEVERGEEAVPESDAYSLGVMVLRWLTGFFYKDNPGALGLLGKKKYHWLPVIAQLLAPTPDRRPKTYSDLVKQLKPIAGRAGAPRPPQPTDEQKAKKRNKTQLGLAVERRLVELGLVPGIRLFKFVVMPDHVHFQLHLRAGLVEPLVTLGRAVGAFKSLCAKDYHEITGESGSLWQQGYHDWLCLSEEMIAAVGRYIDYNPLKFELRYNQPEFLSIREPLAAWRLSPEEFWCGIGATDLLDGETPFISLRISRKLSARQVDEAASRIRRRVGDFVFVGGWISAGEKAVRDMLLNEPQGKIVQILPSAMPHDYRPGSVWLPAIRDKRAAIIARGNSEIEFSRAACLEVNDEARKIATLGNTAQALLSGHGRGGEGARNRNEEACCHSEGFGLGRSASRAGAGGFCRGKAIYWLTEGPSLLS